VLSHLPVDPFTLSKTTLVRAFPSQARTLDQDVVDASEIPDVVFTEIGPVELKGISDPLRLHTARRRVER